MLTADGGADALGLHGPPRDRGGRGGLATRRAAGETFGPEAAWDWHADARGRRVAYVSLDASGVLQQGPHAEKAEGRMANVAAVFNPQPTTARRTRRVWQRRYIAGLLSLPDIGRQLRRECQSVGVAQANRTLVLTDGGAGLENGALDALSGIGQRLKQAGMRWRPPGTTDLCQLRALDKSQPEVWRAYGATSA